MQYRYVTTKENYEDYAAGRVIIATGGSTSFPVRLASEIFQRCLSFFDEQQRITVYDPCCGNGYLLTILGFLHGEQINALVGSDIEHEAVMVARDNLRLLTNVGLQARQKTIEDLLTLYGKQSHQEALYSVEKLQSQLPSTPTELTTWQGNALSQTIKPKSIDVVICDVPYGDNTSWQSVTEKNPIQHLLEAQYSVLRSEGVIAVISDKKQKATHPKFTQRQHETIGKRRFV
ncbi:MAG: hypothetical protein AAFV93_17505, partial [Chloroflexota bacterium]